MPAERMTQPDVQHLRFYQGQLFASADLRDFEAQENRLRQLHAATVHNAYGVVEGLEVAIVNAEAHVTPGTAVDAWGREISLTQPPLSKKLPDPNQSWILVLRRMAKHKENPNAGRLRLPFCEDRADEAVELLWVAPAAFNPGYDIPLTGWNGPMIKEDRTLRRVARPLRRPKIGYNVQEIVLADLQDLTLAELFEEGDKKTKVGLQYDIDTSRAGFQQTPVYLTELKYVVFVSPKAKSTSTASVGTNTITLSFSAPEHFITDETPKGFKIWTFQLPLALNLRHNAAFDEFKNKQKNIFDIFETRLAVFWIGIE